MAELEKRASLFGDSVKQSYNAKCLERRWLRFLLSCTTARLDSRQRTARVSTIEQVRCRREKFTSTYCFCTRDVVLALVAAARPLTTADSGTDLSDGCSSDGQAQVEVEGQPVAEVLGWKRVRGKLWGLVRWEPHALTGEWPTEWRPERDIGADLVKVDGNSEMLFSE